MYTDGAKLRDARLALGLSQVRAAALRGCTMQAWSARERGLVRVDGADFLSIGAAPPGLEGQPQTTPLGEALRAARLAHGWSQQDCASALDISESAWGAYETGRAAPSEEAIRLVGLDAQSPRRGGRAPRVEPPRRLPGGTAATAAVARAAAVQVSDMRRAKLTARCRDILAVQPSISTTDLARLLGVSASTARRLRD